MDDAERRELWEAELEALEATYGIVDERIDDDDKDENGDEKKTSATPPSSTSILSVLSRSPPAVRALLFPRGCPRSASRFVSAELVLECSEGYPGGEEEGEEEEGKGNHHLLVAASLSAPRGLGDARRAELLSKVGAALAEVSASGELCVLGCLIEAALEAITDLNSPEGDCPICLEPLSAGGGGGGASEKEGGGEGGRDEGKNDGDGFSNRLVKLECFHCLHLRCAARWWGATRGEEKGEEEDQQEERGEEEEEEEEANSAPKEKRSDNRGATTTTTTLRCPQCREAAEVAAGAAARLDALSLAPAATAAAAAPEAPLSSSSLPPSSSAPPPPVSSWGLSPPELERLRDEQARRREGVARQAARGALVAERWAVSLSELASSSAAASALAAERPSESSSTPR